MMASFNSTTFLLPNPLVTTTSSLVPFCPVFLKGLHINRWMHTDTFLSTWSQMCIVLQGGSRPPPHPKYNVNTCSFILILQQLLGARHQVNEP